ncbi:response regulator [bacterium]|nr:response regulator [bacterium]
MNEILLLVEDDNNQRFLYQQELNEIGYNVIVSSTAQEALEKLKSINVDLVIMDICMPGKDGIEALSDILEYDKSIPVIINSAYGTYKDNFLTWSAEAYIVKSSDLSELKNTIRNVLDNKHADI